MKTIGLTEFGGPEVLKVVDLPEPEPGSGEVRIRVHAVAVNPTDITFRTGGRAAQLAELPKPYVPGMDVAGIVDKLGQGTDGRLAVGDRVIAYDFLESLDQAAVAVEALPGHPSPGRDSGPRMEQAWWLLALCPRCAQRPNGSDFRRHDRPSARQKTLQSARPPDL